MRVMQGKRMNKCDYNRGETIFIVVNNIDNVVYKQDQIIVLESDVEKNIFFQKVQINFKFK